MYRLHRSTWVLAALSVLILAVVSVPGNFVPERKALEHGWPWAFAARDLTVEMRPDGNFFGIAPGSYPNERAVHWRLDKAQTFAWPALISDLAVSLLIVIAAGAWWELRCRRRAWSRFSLLECMGAAAVVCCGCAYARFIYNDRKVDQEILAAYRKGDTFDRIDETLLDGPFGWLDSNCDIPADWFWYSLQSNNPPYIRKAVTLIHAYPGVGDEQLPLEPLRLLAQYSQLRSIEFYSFRRSADEVIEALPALGQLNELSFTEMSISERGVKGLTKFPNLQALQIQSSGVGLRGLAEIESLKTLGIVGPWKNDLTLSGLNEICDLHQLRSLHLSGQVTIPQGEWVRLRRLRRLEELSLLETLNAIDLAAIASLPHLETLWLCHAGLNDDSILILLNCKRLQRLSIRGSREVTCSGLRLAIERIPLKELKVSKGQFTADELAFLRTARPAISIDDSLP